MRSSAPRGFDEAVAAVEAEALEPDVDDEAEVEAGGADAELPADALAVDEVAQVDATEDVAQRIDVESPDEVQRIDVESAQTASDEAHRGGEEPGDSAKSAPPDQHEPGHSADDPSSRSPGRHPPGGGGSATPSTTCSVAGSRATGDDPEPAAERSPRPHRRGRTR